MEFLGTKAPWTIRKEFESPLTVKNDDCGEWLHNSIYIKEESGRKIAKVDYSTDTPNMGWGDNETIEKWEANSLLISKAPELLEMLKEILRVSDEGYVENYKGGFSEWENELAEVTQKAKELIKEATEF